MKIEGAIWFSAKNCSYEAQTLATIGIVWGRTVVGNEKKCYIGVIERPTTEIEDAKLIAENGTPFSIPYDLNSFMFPRSFRGD